MKIKPPKNLKNLDKPLSGDVRSEFMDFLLNRGYEYDSKKGLITDGSIGRAYINGDAKNKQNGWYQLWLDQEVPYGRIGDYRISSTEPTAVFRPENAENWAEISPERKKEIQEETKQREQKRKAEQEEHYKQGAERASKEWELGAPCETHPYLEKKNVCSYGLRVDKNGSLMIPI